jgi:hypothetical protein
VVVLANSNEPANRKTLKESNQPQRHSEYSFSRLT